MPSQQRRTGHLPREGMLTQGTDTHLGGTFTQKGTLTGRGYSPGRDTRQGGPLTREGHSPGRDTHQEGTLTREGHSPGRDTHSRRGTLTQEDTAGHARDALDLGDVVVEKVLVAGSAVHGAVAEDAPERGGH